MMENFIKKHIENYQPTFKEAYWLEASKLLKRKRRKRLFIYWFSGLGSALLLTLSYLYITTSQGAKTISLDKTESTSNSTSIHTEHDPSANKHETSPIENNDFAPGQHVTHADAESKQEYTDKISDTQHINKKNLPANKKSEKSPSTGTPIRKSASKIDRPISQIDLDVYESPSEEKPRDEKNELASAKMDKQDVRQPSKTKTATTSKTTSQIAINAEASGDISKDNDTDLLGGLSKAYTSIDAISLSTLLPLSRDELRLPFVAQQVIRKKSNAPRTAFAPHFGMQLGATMYNGKNDKSITQFGLNIDYRKSLGKHLYGSVGIGGGTFRGEFESIEEQKTTFGSFVASEEIHTLTPQSMYYVSIPIQVGYQINKVSFGLAVEPSYVVGVHGTYEVTRHDRKIVQETSGTNRYAISESTSSAANRTWLTQKNLDGLNIPVGLFVEHQIAESWRFGIRANRTINTFMNLNKAVNGRDRAFSMNNQINGGLYVRYKF